jgi:hypothetical protein
MNENVTLTFKVELTKKQYEILRPWKNMPEWITCEIEKILFKHMQEMNNPSLGE